MLPTCDRSYVEKAKTLYRKIINWFSPSDVTINMDLSPVQKKNELPNYSNKIFNERFEVLMDVHFNAFSIETMRRLSGPDFFRYGVGHILAFIDRFLCQNNICTGRNRIIVALKKKTDFY